MSRTTRSMIAALAAAGLALGTDARAGTDATAADGSAPENMREKISFARALSDAFNHAASVIEPAVVHVTSIEQRERIRRDVFGRRFRTGDVIEQPTGLGSGVIIDERGYIVTNNHVIAAGDRLVVRLEDGREFDAQLIGGDAPTDIAVLKISADDLTAATFGDSEALDVGEWVIAVGSPFGFEQTVTAGIVSAKARPGLNTNANAFNPNQWQEFIQTDAAINPGNSGGPLVDLEGRVVGINTAIYTRSGGSNGLSFAIPADLARAATESIIKTGQVQRGWLGVNNLRTIDANRARALGIEGGVIVAGVVEGGPADQAGLRPGDVIVSFNARTTENVNRLRNAIAIIPPSETAEVVYFREDRRRSTTVNVIDRETGERVATRETHFATLGIIAREAILTSRSRRGGREEPIPAILVYAVDPDGPAGASGLRPGDVIIDVEGDRVESMEDFSDRIERIDRRALERGVDLNLYRNGLTGSLTIGS